MSKFTTELCIEITDNGLWRLTRPLVYESDLIGKVTAPEGFLTDLASVPRVPIIFALWGDRAHREAVIHDYLFKIGSEPEVSWSTANNVFLEAMKCRGVGWHIRYPMYWGVVMGSYWSWKRKGVDDGEKVLVEH